MIPTSIIDRRDTNDRGVSPVIGVILMVAITVILAAVIGTFVLDLGQSAGNSAPSASLTVSVDETNDNMTISHKGGDSLNLANTRISVGNDSSSITYEPANSETSYAVGSDITLDIINANTGSALNPESGATGFDLVSGNQYEVQVIDTESQRVIFETTVTA